MKRFWKHISLIVSFFVILAGICHVTKASGITGVYFVNASELCGESKYPEEDGKVFAGWYMDEDLTEPVQSAADFDEDGGAYAKFADEDVLTVKFQVTAVTKTTSADTDLRMLTSVDTLNYKNVGFVMKVNNKEKDFVTNKVYTEVYGIDSDGQVKTYKPDEFSEKSNYIMAFSLTDIPNEIFGKQIQVTPVWTTMDGTLVTGKTRTAVIYNELDDAYIDIDDISYGTVWSAPSTVKILGKYSDYSGIAGGASLDYRAVRNEYESLQLAITANQNISAFELFASDLHCGDETILAENVDVYVEKYVTYTDNQSDSNYSGERRRPDALIPMEAADTYGENKIQISNQNYGVLWVTVYVPKNIAPGTYTGNFVLSAEGAFGKELIKVPVSLTVEDYTLSDESSARTLFRIAYESVGAGELDGSLEMMEYYYDFYQDYRISLQSLPTGTLSGEEMAAYVDENYERLTSYTITNSHGETAKSNFANRGYIIKDQILSIVAVSTKERNLLDKAMFYFIDEPRFMKYVGGEGMGFEEAAGEPEAVATKIKALNAVLEEIIIIIQEDADGQYTEFKKIDGWENCIRNIPNIVTMNEYSAYWVSQNQDHELIDLLNCICIQFDAYDDYYGISDLLSLCEREDIRVWWYGCTSPLNPWPTYHITDTNLLSARTVSWAQSIFEIEGNLYWDTAGYTDGNSAYRYEFINTYETPDINTTEGNVWPAGDGFLTYPGAAYGVYGPIPSMRLMSIRDGMEEYEIIEELKTKATGEFGEKYLDSLYNTISGDRLVMRADGDSLNFAALRSKLLDDLTVLEDGLGFAVGVTSSSGSIQKTKTITFYVQSGATATITEGDGTLSKKSDYQYTYKYSYYTWSSDPIGNVRVVVSNAGKSKTYSFTQTSAVSASVASYVAEITPVTVSNEAQGNANEVMAYNAEEGTEVLMSFDSYKEITESGLRVSKLLGKTKVNKDATYITEGNGSWMITPEGDYGDMNGQPWFRMRCTGGNTTFKTDNFFAYDKVLMDVYNASDEEATIEWCFTVLDVNGNYTATEKVAFKLQPNAWTTCEYDLTDEIYNSYFDLTSVKYMTVTFLDKKQSADDETPTLCLDNLRGHIWAEQRQQMAWDSSKFDFEDGISFEEEGDRYLFTTKSNNAQRVELSRVAYVDTNLKEPLFNSFGDYVMRGVATGVKWPQFTIQYNKTYKQNSVLSFWIYVETDAEIADESTYRVEAKCIEAESQRVYSPKLKFNEWVQVKVQLNKATDHTWIHVNLDSGLSDCLLGDEAVNIYFDNFMVEDARWGVVH